MRGRWVLCLFGGVLATLVLSVPPATAFSGRDFDGDGVPNRSDNCLVVANPGQRPGSAHHLGAACSGRKEGRTIEALRFDYTTDQLDRIYGSLHAGRMPGWGVETTGHVRCELGIHCLGFDQNRPGNTGVNDRFVPLLWRGQVFFTHKRGGYMYNRTLDDNVWTYKAEVAYGPSLIDGRRAIIATYPGEYNPPPVNNIVLDCRTVQAGDLFCYAWLFVIEPFSGPRIQLFYVFEDANDPGSAD